ncbi:MAG: HEAT repeat domain-containing protein [Elusimicrobia bacterium]|nr:HEAT repeat domain-containing protein [Elusimicrobiota bacterium]
MAERNEFLGCGRAYSGLSGPNIKGVLLGRATRYAPDRSFDTLHIALDIDIDFRRRSAHATCRTQIRAFSDKLKRLEFDAVDLQVSATTVDGKRVRHTNKKGKLTLSLPKALIAGQEAEVVVRYKVVKPKSGLHFVYPGPHNPKNPVQVWSQSQPEDARYWFPCHDAPHEKTTNEMRITVPKGFRAVSNGALIETKHRGGTSTYHWKMDKPHSIYLISLAAGKFSEIADSWDGIPVTYYCEKGREADARRGMGKTPKAVEFFSKMTGVRYPYEKYAQVAVAEYPGGMEHTTCTTQTDAILIDKRAALDCDMDLLMAHELAHQWFGDLVTCRDWSHAWLNEGFATYFEVLFQEHDKGKEEADYEMLGNARVYFDEDARRYRRAIVCSTYKYPWILFDRHLYEKGAWVLHMLRRNLGDELWWKCVGHYLRKHRDQSVETSDLMAAIEEVTGRNMKPFFDQWIFKSGYPQFRVQYDWNAKTKTASLWVLQTQDVSDETPLFKVKADFRFTGRGWVKDYTEELSEKEHRFTYRLPSEPLDFEFDPDYWLLKKVTIRKPQAMWRHQLLRAKRARSRLAAADQVAYWGSDESAELLAKAVRTERFWGAACEMAAALGSIRSELAFKRLTELVAIRQPKVRRAVLEALARHARPQSAALIAKLARRDPSARVEAEACRQLGWLDGKRRQGLLRKALSKASWRDMVAAGALGGLAARRDKGALELLKRMSRAPHAFGVRAEAMRHLADYAAFSPAVVPWLCELTAEADERLNLQAVGALGRLEDRRALPTLEKLKSSPNSRIRVYAEEAIAKIRAGIEPKK